MSRIRPACCALAANGHVAAAAQPTSVMNVRRCISVLGALASAVCPIQSYHKEGEDGLTSNNQCQLWVCAVERRRFPVGANPARQPLQPEASEQS